MRRTYILVYFALILLLAVTTASAYLHLGVFNGILNIVIAIIKAVLIIAFFMHVRFARKPTLIFVFAGFVWLSLLVGITMSDYLTRGLLMIYGK